MKKVKELLSELLKTPGFNKFWRELSKEDRELTKRSMTKWSERYHCNDRPTTLPPTKIPTPMPEWLERQLDNVEKTVDTWSDGKREAAGLPPKEKVIIDATPKTSGWVERQLDSSKEITDNWPDSKRGACGLPKNRYLKPSINPFTKDIGFILEVLSFFEDIDMTSDLLWRVESGAIRFSVICNDLFIWGSADGEYITPETMPILRQSVKDCLTIWDTLSLEYPFEGIRWGLSLYCARVRKCRPQGASYPSYPELVALFDECGPVRETGISNPPVNLENPQKSIEKSAPSHTVSEKPHSLQRYEVSGNTITVNFGLYKTDIDIYKPVKYSLPSDLEVGKWVSFDTQNRYFSAEVLSGCTLVEVKYHLLQHNSPYYIALSTYSEVVDNQTVLRYHLDHNLSLLGPDNWVNITKYDIYENLGPISEDEDISLFLSLEEAEKGAIDFLFKRYELHAYGKYRKDNAYDSQKAYEYFKSRQDK